MTKQTVTVNVHNPQVKKIDRLPGMPNREMTVELGDVTLFMTTAEWYDLRAAVQRFLHAELEDASGGRICPECAFIGDDDAETTEHVFAEHPDEVAR